MLCKQMYFKKLIEIVNDIQLYDALDFDEQITRHIGNYGITNRFTFNAW